MTYRETDPFKSIIQASYGNSAAQDAQPVDVPTQEWGRAIYSAGRLVSERSRKSYTADGDTRFLADFGHYLVHSCMPLDDEFEPDPEWIPMFIDTDQVEAES